MNGLDVGCFFWVEDSVAKGVLYQDEERASLMKPLQPVLKIANHAVVLKIFTVIRRNYYN